MKRGMRKKTHKLDVRVVGKIEDLCSRKDRGLKRKKNSVYIFELSQKFNIFNYKIG